MSHFTCLVIERADGKDADGLLAPYDETIEVAPYEVECYCAEDNLRTAVLDAMRSKFGGSFDTAIRKPWWTLSEAERPEWSIHIQPWQDAEDKFLLELADKRLPDAACEECHGTGKRLSQYNPSSKWDWYELGGRWSGKLVLKESGAHVDSALYKDIALPIELTFAFVTPDGVWHEKAKMGWWAMTSDEREAKYAKEWQAMLDSLRPDDVLNLYDLHI